MGPRSPNAARAVPRTPGVKSFTAPGAHLLAFYEFLDKSASQRRAIKAERTSVTLRGERG